MYQLFNSDIFGSLSYIHKDWFITFNIIYHKFLKVITFTNRVALLDMSISKFKKKAKGRKCKKCWRCFHILPQDQAVIFFPPVLLMAFSFYTFGYGAILPPLYKTNVSSGNASTFLRVAAPWLKKPPKTIPKFLFNSTSLAGPVRKHYDASVQYSFDLVRSGLVGVLENEIKRIKLWPPT